jgi:Fic family protein
VFTPVFEITPAIADDLVAIDEARLANSQLPIDVEMLASLRETARLGATHYSTQIEGNRLSDFEVSLVVAGSKLVGRERDEIEVRNYYRAIDIVEELALNNTPITVNDIQLIHGWVMQGRSTRTPYRDGQNDIRDSRTGKIVYLPPEAGDVPVLMAQLVEWLSLNPSLPAPVIAAIAHYQFATIHPYYDGNGRTARLLTTLLLWKLGFSLKGIYNLEEYYAKNLDGYYDALNVGSSHNYYFGRAEASITPFIAYFCRGMADALEAVQRQAERTAQRGGSDNSVTLRLLDAKQRLALTLFRRQAIVTTQDLADHLNLGVRTIHKLCDTWCQSGFLEVHDASRKSRAYRLTAPYETLVNNIR